MQLDLSTQRQLESCQVEKIKKERRLVAPSEGVVALYLTLLFWLLTCWRVCSSYYSVLSLFHFLVFLFFLHLWLLEVYVEALWWFFSTMLRIFLLRGIVVSALAWHSLGREIESRPRVRELLSTKHAMKWILSLCGGSDGGLGGPSWRLGEHITWCQDWNLCTFTFTFKGVGNVKIDLFFLKNWHPVRRPMSFAAKEKNKYIQNQRQTNTSHCPTKTITKTDTYPLKVISLELFDCNQL